MKRYIPTVLILAFAALLISGCHYKRITVQEVLQVPQTSSIYTNYNIWYEDPDEVSTLNYEQGKILPYGTEVDIVAIYDEELTFKDKKTGTEYTMVLDMDWMPMPIEDYIRQLFTTEKRSEREAAMSPVVAEKVSRGVVDKGMTRKEVLIACGYPAPYRTPDLKLDTWIFFIDDLSSKRVVFKKDKVVKVLTLK